MFKPLVLLMIIIPALEIWGLIAVGQIIGAWQTFGLILLTGFFGAWFAKKEAVKVWSYARNQLSAGQLPRDSILDGICIFAGGLLLLAPGFITDTLGLFLVLPATRPFFKGWILYLIQKKLLRGSFRFFIRK